MAKHNQKKKRTKKYTGGRARTEAVRQDYRAGGRVGFAEGDVVIDPRTGRALPSTQDRTQQQTQPVQEPVIQQRAALAWLKLGRRCR